MTPEQIELVKGTSYVLLSVRPDVADAFYAHLFGMAPETRRFFQADMSAQKVKLTSMLASLIGMLGRPDIFDSIVRRTGRDHAALGILPQHYDLAGEALIAALSASLGSSFTPEVRAAWQALYGTIQREMLAA